MTRDEVLTEVSKAAELFDGLAMDCCDEPGRVRWESRAAALRAAAEIIRASGWRPIAEAPEKDGYFAKRIGQNWIRCYFLHKQNEQIKACNLV